MRNDKLFSVIEYRQESEYKNVNVATDCRNTKRTLTIGIGRKDKTVFQAKILIPLFKQIPSQLNSIFL